MLARMGFITFYAFTVINCFRFTVRQLAYRGPWRTARRRMASGIVKCLVGIRQGLGATAFRDPASEPRASSLARADAGPSAAASA